jgi:ribose transport system substrate-binding protein
MCGYKDAMKAIIAGEMLATIECSPKFGPIVFKYISALEQGQAIRSRIVMPGKTYDITNSEELINTEGY